MNLLNIIWALLARYFYLLFYGMWKGECAYTEWEGLKIYSIQVVDGEFWTMGATLIQPCRVSEEGLRVVKLFRRGRNGNG